MKNTILNITSEMSSYSASKSTAAVNIVNSPPSSRYNLFDMRNWTTSQWISLVETDPTYFFYILMEGSDVLISQYVNLNEVLLDHARKCIKFIQTKPEIECLSNNLNRNKNLWIQRGFVMTIDILLQEIETVKRALVSSSPREVYPPQPRFTGGRSDDDNFDYIKGSSDKGSGYESFKGSSFRAPSEGFGSFGKGYYTPSKTPSLLSGASRIADQSEVASAFGGSKSGRSSVGRASNPTQDLTPTEHLDLILGGNGALNRAIELRLLTTEIRDRLIELFENSDSYWDPSDRVFKFSFSMLNVMRVRYPKNPILDILFRYCEFNFGEAVYEESSNPAFERCLKSGNRGEMNDCINKMFVGMRQVTFGRKNEIFLEMNYGQTFASMWNIINAINQTSPIAPTGFRR